LVNIKGCTFKIVLSLSALFAEALSCVLGLVLLLASMSNLRHSDFRSMSSTGYINFIAKAFLRSLASYLPGNYWIYLLLDNHFRFSLCF
jgi:hypothetical protein